MTKEMPLGRGQVATVDDGDFALVSTRRWHAFRGTGSRTAYAVSKQARGLPVLRMHNLLLGPGTEFEVDHINGDGLDNRRANLRLCSRAQNTMNRRRHREGPKGAYLRRDRWVAVAGIDYRQINLGGYSNAVEAAYAYDVAAKRLHGEFAALNFGMDRDWILPIDRAAIEAGVAKRLLAALRGAEHPPLSPRGRA